MGDLLQGASDLLTVMTMLASSELIYGSFVKRFGEACFGARVPLEEMEQRKQVLDRVALEDFYAREIEGAEWFHIVDKSDRAMDNLRRRYASMPDDCEVLK